MTKTKAPHSRIVEMTPATGSRPRSSNTANTTTAPNASGALRRTTDDRTFNGLPGPQPRART
jgi:hypothetical protein